MHKKNLRYVLFICFTFCLIGPVSAQISNRDSAFLSDFFASQNIKSQVLYVKEIDHRIISEVCNEIAQKDTIYQWLIQDYKPSSQKRDSFFFKVHEKRRIAQELLLQQGMPWPELLLPYTKALSQETINQVFKDKTKGWLNFYQQLGKSFYRFSRPIFLRNETYCLFYYENLCGYTCGEGVLALYRKEDNTWKQYITLYEWIS